MSSSEQCATDGGQHPHKSSKWVYLSCGHVTISGALINGEDIRQKSRNWERRFRLREHFWSHAEICNTCWRHAKQKEEPDYGKDFEKATYRAVQVFLMKQGAYQASHEIMMRVLWAAIHLENGFAEKLPEHILWAKTFKTVEDAKREYHANPKLRESFPHPYIVLYEEQALKLGLELWKAERGLVEDDKIKEDEKEDDARKQANTEKLNDILRFRAICSKALRGEAYMTDRKGEGEVLEEKWKSWHPEDPDKKNKKTSR